MSSFDFQKQYLGFTLVDITATGVTRGNSHRRDQQRNWETVLQSIGILAQPLDIMTPKTVPIDLAYTSFGNLYSKEQSIWIFGFRVEHTDVFKKNHDNLGALKECFNQVPFITGLDETARFLLPVFYCEGAIKNIYFKNNMDYLSDF